MNDSVEEILFELRRLGGRFHIPFIPLDGTDHHFGEGGDEIGNFDLDRLVNFIDDVRLVGEF